MILKSADDKSKRVQLLKELQQSSQLSAYQRQWLKDELIRLQHGLEGEREAAFHIDRAFGSSDHYGVLHDLRFVIEGETCQIDHLLIGRAGFVFLVESKNYGADVSINEYGEFSVTYGRDAPFGVPSPLEQSKRHEPVLKRLFERLDIKPRVGEFKFVHAVAFHPRAVIQRPDSKRFDASNVIKMDSFGTWHEQWVDKSVGVLDVLSVALNIRSGDTVREWGEKLMRQHRPADLLALPSFMQREPVAERPAPEKVTSVPRPAQPAKPAASIEVVSEEAGKKRPVCDHCGVKLDFRVREFCARNAKRFSNGYYCFDHQALFPTAR